MYDVLNIRADHSASSKLLGTIPANAKFKVTKADGKWAHVEYNGISGCVSMEYIQKVATQTTAPQTTTQQSYNDYKIRRLFVLQQAMPEHIQQRA